MPGRVEGTGTYFEVTDSEYLNITLASSEPVHLVLESVPEMVVMDLEAAEGASQTEIALGGFVPSTTYYKYEDDYHNGMSFTTDGNGTYAYTQDLSKAHLVFIQPQPGTKYIPSDTSIGTWDLVTRTYTLTTDVHETIQINENNLTLDGAGYTITGSGSGSGVYLSSRTGVTIKNLNVQGWTFGIYLWRCSGNSLTGNTASNNSYGIYLPFSSTNALTGNTALNNFAGIWLDFCSGNTLTGNTASNNYYVGIAIYYSSGCTLRGNTASNNTYGIFLCDSGGCTLQGNTASNNSYGIFLYRGAFNNQVYNNNFIGNSLQAYVSGSSGNIFNLAKPTGGNFWSDWTSPDADNDGFVDNPYVFSGGQDNLPWTRQNGWLNQPPVAEAGPDQTVEQTSAAGAQVTVDGSGSSDPDNDQLTYTWKEGAVVIAGPTTDAQSPVLLAPGTHAITLVVDDGKGGADTDEVTVVVQDTRAPLVSWVEAIPNPVAVNVDISLMAAADDSTTGESNIASAEYQIDDWGWQPMEALDGAFDEPTEDVAATIPAFWSPGVFNVYVRATDAAENVSESACILLAVYDPSAGFVTGGGWIMSPAGAYVPDPLLTGKASFGFVAKYKKGASEPTGQTEFRFRAADLNFHSSSYQWLVVAGASAKFKGSGTINGAGDYGFMLTATDGQVSGGGGVDKFRIKIWSKEAGAGVVYDNQMGAGDTADPTTVIGGGNIVIHKGK